MDGGEREKREGRRGERKGEEASFIVSVFPHLKSRSLSNSYCDAVSMNVTPL